MSESPLPAKSVSRDPLDHGDWQNRLRDLPLRATVAFAVRCAKRVQPFLELGRVLPAAYAAGIDPGDTLRDESPVASATAAFQAASEAAVHALTTFAGGVQTAAHRAGFNVTRVDYHANDALVVDLKTLLSLNLGKPGEPGEPIRWNDPRLGPLWPHGEPEWYAKALQACRELEDQLRRLPLPGSPPDDPRLVAQMEQWWKAEQLDNEGKFNEYRGEYVFFSDGVIFGHGRNLADLRPVAEAKAAAVGIPPERLVDYFVPGE